MKTIKKSRLSMLGPILAALLFTFYSCTNNTRTDSVERAENMNDTTAQVNEQDAHFAVNAADINMGTLQLADLASDRVSDDRVKSIADMVQTEHENAQVELEQIGSNKMITLPMSLSDDRRDDLNDIRDSEQADNFDRRYLDLLIEHHEEARKLYENASNDVRDVELQAFATKYLPLIKKHEQQLKNIWDSLGYQRDMPNVIPVTNE